METNFANLSIWIQIATAVLILATLWVYFFQLKTMRMSTKGQNSISIINYIQEEKTRIAREIVMGTLKHKPYEDWTQDEKKAASRVCSNYDVVAILIYQQGLVSQNLITDNWGPSIIKCYKILEVHILEMQKEDNAGPEYWDDFTKLYKEVVRSGKFNYLLND